MQPLRPCDSTGDERFLVHLSCENGVDGGDDGTRTHDPLLAKQALFQLSYIPKEMTLNCGNALGPPPGRSSTALQQYISAWCAWQYGSL